MRKDIPKMINVIGVMGVLMPKMCKSRVRNGRSIERDDFLVSSSAACADKLKITFEIVIMKHTRDA